MNPNPNPDPNPDPNPNQVRLAHMQGGRVLGEMNVLPKRPLPVPPDHFVTEEQVAAHVGAITAQLNAVRPPAGGSG